MFAQSHFVHYGKKIIPFQMHFSQRKSLEISVYPDKSIFVKAPEGTHIEDIEGQVKKRARWIGRQIRYFDQFLPRTPTRKYKGGENHSYFGKKYRLKITQTEKTHVRLKDGFIFIDTKDTAPEKIQRLLDQWYRVRANIHLKNIFNDCWKKFQYQEYQKPILKIQMLKKRWGSLSTAGTLSLNIQLIKAPKECIEYVIVHELCHLAHYHHGAEFFKLLTLTLPDWAKRKYKLEISLI